MLGGMLAFLCSLLPVLTPVLTTVYAQEVAVTEEKGVYTDWHTTHKLVAENNKFNLYMCEDDLSLVVEDRITGAFMESSQSFNDSFIKVNGDQSGILSYNKMTELVLRYYDKQGAFS